jgi:hypothetical protein
VEVRAERGADGGRDPRGEGRAAAAVAGLGTSEGQR